MKPYYSDDKVQLFHGDCREVSAWLDADVLVTDPPYGIARHRLGGRNLPVIAGDDDTTARDDVLAAWGDRPALVFGTWRIPKPVGVKNVLVWDKGTDLGMGASTPWGLSHEEVYVLGAWPTLVPGGRVREGGTPSRVPSVLRAPKPNNASRTRVREHPTPKPLSLMEQLISRCPRGLVADPFAGSGSTLVAAAQLGRKSIGVELHEPYCELIARRLDQGVLDFARDTTAGTT